ncbi:MAG TPA: MarR family transcriptional regulator [Gemmatimonadaceae bacterium]|nr:MarR family transcriptional regulator [Gemmatimonadaceae bacterium]
MLALETVIKLSRSLNSLNAHLLPPLQKEFGITESQLAVLESLHHLGPLTQGQLCQKMLKSGSNLTTVVDNLERDDLVRRERDPNDRRVQIVQLTPKGAELIGRAFPRHVDRVTRAFSALSADEQRELGRLCRKLGRALAEPGGAERRERVSV